MHRLSILKVLAMLLFAGLLAACGGGSEPPGAGATQLPMSVGSQTFAGKRSAWRIERDEIGHTVRDAATDAKTFISFTSNVSTLVFDDVAVNLSVADKSKSVAADDLKMLVELYVAFFNRVPDADGLAYWIDQYRLGMSLDSIAQAFYSAGQQYPDLTGYSGATTNEDFVRVIYKNVLGRSGATAPPDEDVRWWAARLAGGQETKGSLIRTMLISAHTFTNHATWGWVAQLLDNKVVVARSFAIQNGLNYRTPAESIAKTMALVAAITPTDTAAALGTIASVSEPSLDLTSAPTPTAASYAGKYTGTYAGDDAGTWQVTVDSAGNIDGTASSPYPTPTVVSGKVDITSSGASMTVAGGARGSTFRGVMDVASGTVSGTWVDGEGWKGTFTGSR